MASPDSAIYVVQAAALGAFVLARVILRVLDRGTADAPASTPVAHEEKTAPFSRTLLVVHILAFGVLYFGLAQAVIPNRVPEWFPGQRIVGAFLIASSTALMIWALVYFRSWRIRAKLDQGHQLATGGPFRLIRHPIYMGMNLFALGTAVWVPTAIEWVAFALMVLGSDLRARAEERLLETSFGEPYRSYCARTRRFIPGTYRSARTRQGPLARADRRVRRQEAIGGNKPERRAGIGGPPRTPLTGPAMVQAEG